MNSRQLMKHALGLTGPGSLIPDEEADQPVTGIPAAPNAPAGMTTDPETGAIVPSEETQGQEVISYKITFPNLEKSAYSNRPYFVHDWYRSLKTAVVRSGGEFIQDDPQQLMVSVRFRNALAAKRFVDTLVASMHVSPWRIEASLERRKHSIVDPTQYILLPTGIIFAVDEDSSKPAEGDTVLVVDGDDAYETTVLEVSDGTEVLLDNGEDSVSMDDLRKVSQREVPLASLDLNTLPLNHPLMWGKRTAKLHRRYVDHTGSIQLMFDTGPRSVPLEEVVAIIKVANLSPPVPPTDEE